MAGRSATVGVGGQPRGGVGVGRALPASIRPGPSDALRLAMAFSTAERAAEQRRVKLEEIQQLIDAGSLTVRKMTAAERERYPARPVKPRTPRRA